MKNRWRQDDVTDNADLELLVYQSHLVGADTSLVLWGGGNTSIKTRTESFTGQDTNTLIVKGSGSDLKNIEPKQFPNLRLDDVLLLFDRDSMSDDQMVEYLAQCMLDPKSPRPSIETLLHAFLPFRSVVHSHADSIVALTNTEESPNILDQVYAGRAEIVEYIRPGFLLSKLVGQRISDNPSSEGVILVNHGLFTWGDTVKDAYDKHIQLVTEAEEYCKHKSNGKTVFTAPSKTPLSETERHNVAARLSPIIRSLVSTNKSMVLRYDDSSDIMEFVNSKEGKCLSQIGPATPDHTLQTKIKPLWIETKHLEDLIHPRDYLKECFTRYVDDYTSWYKTNTDGNHQMLDPYPRIILMPEVGMWSTGKDAKSSLIAGDIYHHTIEVIKAAEGIGHYSSLSDKDAYDVEYWPMELYKLTLAPSEKELSRRVALITGAANGIGKAIALRLAAEGAHIAITDIEFEKASALAAQINNTCGFSRAVAFVMDVTNENQIKETFNKLRLQYGGLDILISNAGIAPVGAIHSMDTETWKKALDINTTGHFLVSRESINLMHEQGMGGNLVFVGTKNVPSPGKDFGAYSASKAAEVQLAKVLAIENGEYGIRVNVVNPDAVFEGSDLWTSDIKERRAHAHGIDVNELEDFYRQRNLLKQRITAEDVAEAVLFLASPRSSKTTGAMLPVDAGLKDAFPR